MPTRRDLLAMLPIGAAAAQLPSEAGTNRGKSTAPDASIPLWPVRAPGDLAPARLEVVVDRSTDPARPDRAISGISQPRLLVFRPSRPNGAALLIMPGGGYRHVVLDREGFEAATWAQARGFTAFVLLYRLPTEGWAEPASAAISDAQRAVRLIRSLAASYGYAPDKVAAMGFSAGGHLCADLASRFATSCYVPVDQRDQIDARPYCAAPIYPVVSMDPAVAHAGSRLRLLGSAPTLAEQNALSPDMTVSSHAPPHFLVHAEDDRAVSVENTLRLRAALVRQGVPVDTHLFASGGHGFGLAQGKGAPASTWPGLWLAWAHSCGLV